MENQKKLIIGLIALVLVSAGVYFVSASNLKGDFFDRRTGRPIEKAPMQEQKVITQAATDPSAYQKQLPAIPKVDPQCLSGQRQRKNYVYLSKNTYTKGTNQNIKYKTFDEFNTGIQKEKKATKRNIITHVVILLL